MIAAISYNVCLNRNGHVNRHGLRTIVIELYQPGCRRTVSTHLRVPAADFACGRVQPSHPDHDLLNRRIRRYLRHLMLLEDELIEAGVQPTPQQLVEAYVHHQTPSATIAEWVAAVITPSARRTVTKETYRTLVNSLEDFHPGLRVRDLTHDCLCRWQSWMRTERHLAPNTIALRMKALRCLVNEALKRNVLRPEEDPFRHIRIAEITPRREHLTADELHRLETLHTDDPYLAHVRDAFLFCCYTGLRWGDFTRLTSANIITSPTLASSAPASLSSAPVPSTSSSSAGDSDILLCLHQHKTSRPLHLPLAALFAGRPLAILRSYPTPERLAAIGSNRQANTALRTIAHLAGITKHLHWHLARHTCATLLNQHGLRMQEIQYILGHQRLATTERHYAETILTQVRTALHNAFT